MKIPKKAILFVIILAGVFFIPLMYLDQDWGYQFIWLWGIETMLWGEKSFKWIADVLQNSATSGDPTYIFQVLGFVGISICIALAAIAFLANSKKGVVITASSILAAIGLAVIFVTLWYNSSPDAYSTIYSPSGIFLIIGGGCGITLEVVVALRSRK
ncbi:MAG: hypothetical protein ACFFCS_25815 [Candidatus Hodarchaeota archaeon]